MLVALRVEGQMDEPRFRIRSPHTNERGRGLKIEHRHGEDWLPMVPGLPQLSREEQDRRWVVLYRCSPDCGHTMTSEVPA
jgi:hypothetical protein